jgi:hypothetical protein
MPRAPRLPRPPRRAAPALPRPQPPAADHVMLGVDTPQGVLLHRLGQNLWRIVFQLGTQADPDAEQQPARVAARLHEMLGQEQTFEIVSHAVRQVAGRLIASMRHGRMSTPASYPDSPLNTPDEDDFAGPMAPGTHCVDAPVGLERGQGWLLPQLGAGFVLLSFGAAPTPAVSVGGVPARVLGVGRDLRDTDGVLAGRYDARPGTVILIRPDGHVAARWRRWDEALIETAMRRCLCL